MTRVLDPNAIYTLKEVSAWLKHSERYLYEARTALTKEAGFPRPISPRGRPRWRGETLLEWARREHADEVLAAAAGARPRSGTNVLDLRTEAMRRKRTIG